MTLGGIVANIPDAPRLWRVDFPSLPLAETLGSMDLELWLHSIGNLFFMHRSLDAQPKEFSLLGLAVVVGLYNLCLIGLLWHSRRSRTGVSDRHHHLDQSADGSQDIAPPSSVTPDETSSSASTPATRPGNGPVIGRIGSG
jgi:hypothetical protein